MENYFNRQIKLWGLDTQNSLQNKHIVIIGCGGLGCSLGYALGTSGIGHITLIDFDVVGIHNIHRQIAFSQNDENKKKCEVLKNIILSKNPFVKVDSIDGDFEYFKSLNIQNIDLLLDATDNLPTRAAIDAYSKKISTPWIYASVEEFHGQICFFDKANFESVFTVKDRIPNGIACPIVMQIASIQANIALRYLAGLAIKEDHLNYVFYDDTGELTLQKFGLPKG
jgi:molybdopterin/thiamine biosynthesis adenylyltransferase